MRFRRVRRRLQRVMFLVMTVCAVVVAVPAVLLIRGPRAQLGTCPIGQTRPAPDTEVPCVGDGLTTGWTSAGGVQFEVLLYGFLGSCVAFRLWRSLANSAAEDRRRDQIVEERREWAERGGCQGDGGRSLTTTTPAKSIYVTYGSWGQWQEIEPARVVTRAVGCNRCNGSHPAGL